MQVKCINPGSGLTQDKIYQVVSETTDNYWVVNDRGNAGIGYLKARFEVVAEETSTPAPVYVKCIDNNEGRLSMTVGKVYAVNSESDANYHIINDKGEKQAYLKSRFEVVSDAPTPAPTPVAKATQPDAEEERLRQMLRFKVDTRFECPKCGGSLPCNWH